MSEIMNFDKKTICGKYEVQISTLDQKGYFEDESFGDEQGGGLWFEKKSLIDYDGMACLPNDVIKAVRELGFTVPREFENHTEKNEV